MKKFSKLLAIVFIFVALLGSFNSATVVLADGTPVIATDNTIVCNGAPAGMGTVVEDLGNGYVSLKLKLKGQMTIKSFSWAVGYDKSKVIPVTVVDKTEAPNSKLSTAVQIAPYFEIPGSSLLTSWPISSYEIDNTTGPVEGNYLLIGYARNTGSPLTLASNQEVTILKLTFKKIVGDASTAFSNFYKTEGGTIVSKLIYSTTNIIQQGQATSVIFVRPDLFYTQFIPYSATHSVTVTSSTALAPRTWDDPEINAWGDTTWATTVRIMTSFQTNDSLENGIIDPITKQLTISGLSNGTYVMAIERLGYLSRYVTVTIAGDDVSLGDKPLLAGDFYVDYSIESTDVAEFLNALGSVYGDSAYDPKYDVTGDASIESEDVALWYVNYGKSVWDYTDSASVNFDN